MKSKNQIKLESFTKYCEQHPEERFFQALRNWVQKTVDSRWNWIYVEDGEEKEDTFYWD